MQIAICDDGKDGMETAREIRKKNQKMVLIFVTAMEEFVNPGNKIINIE